MPQHPSSRANLRPNDGAPVGTKKKTNNGYWRVKVSKDYPYSHHSHWTYTHVALAEQQLGRPLNPNERVYFTSDRADRKNPQPGDVEVRIIAISSGKPPGRRSYWARRVIDLRKKLQEAETQLAAHNEFYGRKPDDTSDAFETRELIDR